MRMPFGKYKDHDLSTLPDDYLLWLIANISLRDPFRSAVTEEITGRDLTLPPLPSPPHDLHNYRNGPATIMTIAMAHGRWEAIHKRLLLATFPCPPDSEVMYKHLVRISSECIPGTDIVHARNSVRSSVGNSCRSVRVTSARKCGFRNGSVTPRSCAHLRSSAPTVTIPLQGRAASRRQSPALLNDSLRATATVIRPVGEM